MLKATACVSLRCVILSSTIKPSSSSSSSRCLTKLAYKKQVQTTVRPFHFTTTLFSPRAAAADLTTTQQPKTMEQLTPTTLEYFHDMWKTQSQANFHSLIQTEDGRQAMILESTIFHPQGGGQPADNGFIAVPDSSLKFVVKDVRAKDGVVYHYGDVESQEGAQSEWKVEKGTQVELHVDEARRKFNARLHSAGHLLDSTTRHVGLGHLEGGKGYHFPDGPYVEYKGVVPPGEVQTKLQELEKSVNDFISKGGKVSVAVLPYEEAAQLCGGELPPYIPKGSTPRIVKLGENPGCPCGGTHVADISDIQPIKISQIRTKKGVTKVYYNVAV